MSARAWISRFGWLARVMAVLCNAAVGVVAMFVGISACVSLEGVWNHPDPLLLGVALATAVGSQIATFALVAPPCRIQRVVAGLAVGALVLMAAIGLLPLWNPANSPWATIGDRVPLLLLAATLLNAVGLLIPRPNARRPEPDA